MKKYGILNSNIAKLADDLGHMDWVCIGDLGLPVPKGVDKIDLALRKGSPSFLEVLKEYSDHVLIEKIFLAEEIKEQNTEQWQAVLDLLGSNIIIEYISHEELKAMNTKVKAVIRTGEDTPYSNIILQSGVII
ncbi:D-ribose pyranase [Streptococcus pneumoniae]|nr:MULTISPECIES: D-ribose pyranase [Streptococcus]EJH13562.1 D-ribose pyranase [Streptococcus pneumoniae GA60080]KAA3421105.1 D-ribose pyranase [Streptococcus pneumoniae]MBW5095877.1 D-ribose pyranase [Streptococcus pneumoniae]MBW5114166.1 D-ribose pyranase [Streptococcus pneumoniae]MBW5125348.1 D-ribose pyranase [Streptococcus pneumoniae]